GARIAIPAIVRYVPQNGCAFRHQLANLTGENGFVTDKNPEFLISGLEGRARGSFCEVADGLSQAAREREYGSKGNVFTKGHEMNLAVSPIPLARRAHQRGRIENG